MTFNKHTDFNEQDYIAFKRNANKGSSLIAGDGIKIENGVISLDLETWEGGDY